MATHAGFGAHAIVAFVGTANAPKARLFYRDVLGLKLVSEDDFALVFDANGTMLRVTRGAERAAVRLHGARMEREGCRRGRAPAGRRRRRARTLSRHAAGRRRHLDLAGRRAHRLVQGSRRQHAQHHAVLIYSLRNAISGSVRMAATAAGSTAAAPAATIAAAAATALNASRSCVAKPRPTRTRPAQIDNAPPAASPAATITAPGAAVAPSMRARSAPNAIRIASSVRRHATSCATTPKRPMLPRTTARSANPRNVAVSTRRAGTPGDAETTSAIGRARYTGSAGSRRAASSRTAAITSASGRPLRTTITFECDGSCSADTYTVGTIPSSSARWFTSPATPTTSAVCAAGGNHTRRPTGSSDANRRSASERLTTTRGGAAALSRASNDRPATMGIRMTSKYPAL